MDAAHMELSLPYLGQIAEQVRALGGDVDVWLMKSGLSRKQLEDPELKLPLDVFFQVVSNALSASQEPAFGLLLGQRLQMQTHGALGYAAMSSGTIRQALSLLETFIQTRFSLIALSVEETDEEVQVRFEQARVLGVVQRPVLETVVMAVKHAVDAIAVGNHLVRSVVFPFDKPSYAPLATELFGCEVRWSGGWAGVLLPQSALDLQLRAADPVAFREAVHICERELERLSTNEAFSGKVRRILIERQQGFPTLETTARLLRLTPRTLHRRLESEGTTFRQVLEDVRHRLALQHLEVASFSLQEIAFTLGYTDFANFRRAFKRWEGLPPSEYRRLRLSGSSDK